MVGEVGPFEKLFAAAPSRDMGTAFAYCYLLADDEPEASAWFFAFYDRHFMVAFTGKLVEET